MTTPPNHDAQPAAARADRAELLRLASALVDGVLSAAGQADLERRLLADPAARDAFRGFMRAESILTWELAGGDTSLAQSPPGPGRGSRFALPVSMPMAVAAGLLAALVILALPTWLPGRREPARQVIRVVMPAGEQVATLTDDDHARWDGEPFDGQGNHVASGPLRLAEGSAQITFASGAIVAVHAPAEIEILSADRVFLRSGRITPYVPPSAHGFTVVSPSGEVVDLGTEFTVGVDAAGRTDVFVIDGEVDVASGHNRPQGDQPLRMTQGYGSRHAAGDAVPVTIQRPILIDHFEGPEETVRRLESDADFPSRVVHGGLELPIAAPPGRKHCRTQVTLDHDFSCLAGRQSSISFKVTLPEAGMTTANRALCFVIDDGAAALPMAWEPAAAAAVLVSPVWQVGVRVEGKPICQEYIFSRGEDAVGPYQVVIAIDDTPATRAAKGAATWRVMVNGHEIVRDCSFRLAARPRLQLQTFAPPYSGCDGVAIVDDLSVSVADEPTAAAP